MSNPDEGQVFVNFRNYEFIRSTRFLEPTSLVNEGLVKKKPNEGWYITMIGNGRVNKKNMNVNTILKEIFTKEPQKNELDDIFYYVKRNNYRSRRN